METALRALLKVIGPARGPFGRIQAIQVGCHGNVVMTSSSRHTMNLLSLENPYFKIIKSGTVGHLNNFHDGGLLVATFATKLVLAGLSSEIPRQLVISVYAHARSLCLEHLDGDSGMVVSLELNDAEMMLNVVKSILCSKPLCCLSPLSLQSLALLLVKAYFTTLPISLAHDSPLERVRFTLLRGEESDKSELFDGVLLTTSPQSKQFVKTLQNMKKFTVAVFNISLAGDAEDWPERLTVDLLGYDFSDDGSFKSLIDCADELIRLGVNLVVCQKCIHPGMKSHLQSKGVLSIDRVSIQCIEAVGSVSGASFLSDVHPPFPMTSFGRLEEINYIIRHEKCFLQLKPPMSAGEMPINTILLCASNETSLDELKSTCEQTICTLTHVVTCPKAIRGGGWMERQLADHLRCSKPDNDILHKLRLTKSKIIVGDTPRQYGTIIERFAQCLDALAVQLDPLDGMLTDRPHPRNSTNAEQASVFDSYVVKLNALSTAIEIAIACLRVTNVISE